MLQIAKLAGSLVAILALAWLARRLGLGGDVRLGGADAALAMAAEDGFPAKAAVVDKAGLGALVEGADGRMLLLRRHGVHFVTRELVAPVDARLDEDALTVGAPHVDPLTLALGADAPVWAAKLRRVR